MCIIITIIIITIIIIVTLRVYNYVRGLGRGQLIKDAPATPMPNYIKWLHNWREIQIFQDLQLLL